MSKYNMAEEIARDMAKEINRITVTYADDDNYSVEEDFDNGRFCAQEFTVTAQGVLTNIWFHSCDSKERLVCIDTRKQELSVATVKGCASESLTEIACKCLMEYYCPPFARVRM